MKKQVCFLIALILMLGVLPFPQSRAASQSAAGKVATQSTNLNVRSGPSTANSISGKLEKGSWVTLLTKKGDWWRVRFGANAYGYCSAAYIEEKSGSFLDTLRQNGVSVYRGAGTEYEIKKTLPAGEQVAVLTQSEGWSCILFNGTRKGYIQTANLTSAAASRISLSVPYYAQTNSQWKNVPLGTQGGTIGTIGCTTTCLAMCESFRTQKSVTPDQMAKKLAYTAGGSLYWPANYNTALLSSASLEKVLAILQEGKPVIFGAKKASGTQHWVVVTGFDGTALSAGAFSIRDPGASARKTLADFFAVYPNVYKLAWYQG